MSKHPRETRFSDDEVQEILKRAVTASSNKLVAGDGVSLTELKAIAAEVGIEAEQLESAALEVAREREAPSRRDLLGTSRVLEAERTVAGDLDPDSFPELLTTIRRKLGPKGDANEIRGSLEWSSSSELAERHVMVASTDGNTTIHAASDLSNLAVVAYLPTGILGLLFSIIGFVAAANEANAVGMILSLLLIPALFTVIRAVVGRVAAREAIKLQHVVDELALLDLTEDE